MSLTIENRRFFCTTADVSFGPLFESDEEGEQFRAFLYRNFGDARRFDTDWLAKTLEYWRLKG